MYLYLTAYKLTSEYSIKLNASVTSANGGVSKTIISYLLLKVVIISLNAGLIINKQAVAGIIYAPAKNRLFYSYGKNNSFEKIGNSIQKMDTSKNSKDNKIKFVSYSNKIKPEINKIFKKLNVSGYQRMKSSLKFCVIAANEYDGYVAEPRACEWDIAAGHAILENAGGIITDFDGNEILYGKEGFKNPSIILKRNKNI